VNSSQHYDSITKIWQLVFGEHFHFGCFNGLGKDDLDVASQKLIEIAVQGCNLCKDSLVIDIGCGIGGSSRWLARRYGSRVLGISNSRVGIDIANTLQAKEASQYQQLVNFFRSDILSNKLPTASFDVVWCMEMAHLFSDKMMLVQEISRILKPGGRLMLCDLVLGKRYPQQHDPILLRRLIRVRKAFGPVIPEKASRYFEIIQECGFSDITQIDLSDAVRQTGQAWLSKVERSRDDLHKISSSDDILQLRQGVGEVDLLLMEDLMGYTMLWATKNH